MRRYAARRDSNEAQILSVVEPLGGFWLPTGPFDGWMWDRRAWHLCEVKRPDKEGWGSEFTDDQKRLIIRLNERRIPLNILRTTDDVLKLLNARQTA
jgi:hypothetical protein